MNNNLQQMSFVSKAMVITMKEKGIKFFSQKYTITDKGIWAIGEWMISMDKPTEDGKDHMVFFPFENIFAATIEFSETTPKKEDEKPKG